MHVDVHMFFCHYFLFKKMQENIQNSFISLIEKGVIEITFKTGLHKSGQKLGKTYDHETYFLIKVDNIELLYNKII